MLDYMTEPEAYGKCERCFKRYGFPADWVLEPVEVPTLQEDSDSSTDSGSETDDSVDTQSETEVVALPLAARPGDRGEGRPCPGLSVCTPVLQFLRVCGGWPMGPTQPLTSDRGR